MDIEQWRALGPVAWAEANWVMEDGSLLKLVPWQRAVLEAWWSLRDETTTLAISNVKKTGKTLLNAVLTAWRWLCLPGEHLVLANDEDQSAGRQWLMIKEMCKRTSFARHVKASRLELVYTPTGSRLTALSVDPKGVAGSNHLTASHTEAWGVISKAGVQCWDETTPPPGLKYGLPALRIADSYMGYEGQSDLWHTLVDRALKGERLPGYWGIWKAEGLLLFHMEGEEAQVRCFRGTEDERLAYYAEQARTLRPFNFSRLHLNRRGASEERFVSMDHWNACKGPITPGRGFIGIDAATTHDYAALVMVSLNADGLPQVTKCKVYKPFVSELRHGKPTIDLEATVGADVEELARQGLIDGVALDPWQMHVLALRFEKAGIEVMEIAQTAGRTECDTALYDAVITQQLVHPGFPELDEAIRNAVAKETPRGLRLAKEATSMKIDAAVALSMALYGARSKSFSGFSLA